MKTCAKCQSTFPNFIIKNGKKVNFQRRKYCLSCSPLGKHNTAHPYTKEENDMLKLAYKAAGLEYKDLKEKTNYNECLLKERFETLVFNLKSGNWESKEFKLENELKNKIVEFLVNEYKGEFK